MLQVGGDFDLLEEPLRAQDRRELRSQDLDGDLPAVLTVSSEIDRRHAAAAELPLDRVPIGQGGPEALEEVDHHHTARLEETLA